MINDLVYVSCWGGCTCLFLQYLLLAYTVFNNKKSKIFKLLILGLVLCYLESCLTIIPIFTQVLKRNEKPSSSPMMWYLTSLPMAIVWFLMIQIVLWLYILRIKSLGNYGKYDKYLNYIPLVIAIQQMPNVLITVIPEVDMSESYHKFTISSSVFSFTIALLEIFLFYVLMQKLNFILEYKPDDLRKIGKRLRLASVIVILLEIGMSILRFAFPVDFSISPIINLLKLNIIIQFYSDLLVSVNRECQHSSKLCSYNRIDSKL